MPSMDLTKLTLWIAAVAILSYAAWVWYDCSQDASCHYVHCGLSRLCGMSHKRVAPSP